MFEILDSETFEYLSEDSHQGRHTVLRRLIPNRGIFEPGQYLWTVQDDTDYLWESIDEDPGLRWIEWAQLRPHLISQKWDEIQREEILRIEFNDSEFYVGDVAVIGLGSEIELVPLEVEQNSGPYVDNWIVELTIPSGTDVCQMNLTGNNREWFRKRAVLDEPMTVALRKFKFQEVVI